MKHGRLQIFLCYNLFRKVEMKDPGSEAAYVIFFVKLQMCI